MKRTQSLIAISELRDAEKQLERVIQAFRRVGEVDTSMKLEKAQQLVFDVRTDLEAQYR